MKHFRLVITGNPGVGKHTSAELIAEKTGAKIVDINKVAIANGAIAKKTDRGLDVNVKKLAGLLSKELKAKGDLIIVGHLAPYVIKPAGITLDAVLRRSQYELEKTLEKRDYSAEKFREKLASEILGVSMHDAIKTFGRRKVAELDTTGKTPEQTADEVMSALRKKPKLAGIDWLAQVSERGDMKKFFDY